MKTPSRRSAIKTLAGTALTFSVIDSLAAQMEETRKTAFPALKGRINHSACKWCYGKIPLEDFAKAAKEIGLTGIDLLGPNEWPIVKKYGLTCSMAQGAGKGINDGFNDPKLHDELVASYEAIFPKLKEAGLKNVICFSGNRRGMDDQKGMENCAVGLKRLMSSAEKHGVVMVMELLNSRVDHKDYMCDKSAWGVELCKMVGSENFKMLYDIYHMQIMEGDIIRTIRRDHQYFAHYHTGGNPGRNEIDNGQELYYPAIMQAIVDTGYKGFVAQEFIPKRDPLTSLRESIAICDV
ncbi:MULTISPECIES: hydroxypyruvate isomerase family protein [Larkinella]|uniref:TIM barrel protein n=1 Tax=Larkinella humicola TaxID=2607654 RepID=A0A5N1JAC3_9BACT|nr:TIM barrel protein [Larkinella humicola]KAA9349622.1 TIM barrel protein [Larkinella humicola]